MARGGSICAAICGALLLATVTPGLAGPADYRALTLGGYPVRWLPSGPTERIVLSYKFADHEINQPHAINCKGLRPPTTVLRTSGIDRDAFRDAFVAAFHRWRDVADLTFVEAAPGEKANIIVGEQIDPTGFAFTNLDLADEPRNGIRPIVGASICLNPKRHWKIGYDGNLAVYDLVHTFAHEIGHVIGLDHPVGRAHLMSFRYSESLSGLSEGDRLGAVAIYGPSRLRSEIVAMPAPNGSPEAWTITTTIGRSIDGGSAD
ncbi:MAG: matrixin family metalloprotease [Hyphomicrobiaceae bacterium]